MKKVSFTKIDWVQTLLPLGVMLVTLIVLLSLPWQSTKFLQATRTVIGNDFSWFYILFGFCIFLTTLYVAFSKYGQIKLGKETERPTYSNIRWGMMVFTSTMSADVIFYALTEWSMYAREPFIKERNGGLALWTLTYSLFHWGPIAWSFYIVLAIAFAFMLHVRKKSKQKFSEALRPIFGERVDGLLGKVVNLIAIFALIAGTATTFSVSMPLLSAALSRIFHIQNSPGLSVIILLTIAVIYTTNVLLGMGAISKLSSYCVGLFVLLLGYVFLFGGKELFMLNNGVSALGNLGQNFIGMATWTSPMGGAHSFVKNWTVYYWSYWLVWCTATPFFIATISRGRTLRNMILGVYGWGLAGTSLAFVVLSNYGLGKYLQDGLPLRGLINSGDEYIQVAVKVLETLPMHNFVLLLIVITMMGMYATVFESITLVMSFYSYKNLTIDHLPDRRIRAFWAVTFIILPIALLFLKQSIYGLQSIAIIFALPISILVILIIISFFKDANEYLNGHKRG